jgi:hypothetical protein
LAVPVQLIAGAALGFAASPCGLGAVALAGALHAHAPLVATSFLCVAGIADVRALAVRSSTHVRAHDALAYALLAIALAVVAVRHGGALVHPAIAFALGVCAAASVVAAAAFRRERCIRARLAPALMLFAALAVVPAPTYRATETTLRDLFPNERVTFTGILTRDRGANALVRYAITCCRADAAPVALRLARTVPFPPGAWLRADGTITGTGGAFELAPQHVERIVPPTDPFIYR